MGSVREFPSRYLYIFGSDSSSVYYLPYNSYCLEMCCFTFSRFHDSSNEFMLLHGPYLFHCL